MKKDLVVQQLEDLARERKGSTLPLNKLSSYLYGSASRVERIRFLQSIVSQEPTFNKTKLTHLTREEKFSLMLATNLKAIELKLKYNLSELDFMHLFTMFPSSTPLFLHYSVFRVAVLTQCDEEQLKMFGDKVENFEYLGCYAQTEVAHGTSLTNLETTATYDRTSQTFVIDSPTPTSGKCWPGGLARYSNMALVYANLILDGKSYGPHGFLVPLRDPKTHRVLANVELKDLGLKLAFDSVDNGYARFHKVVIPRKHMLMKFSKVTPEGQYMQPPHPKMAFAVMTSTRVWVIESAWIPLAKAVTIATRYLVQRRQSNSLTALEPQVLDYVSLQAKLFDSLSLTFAFNNLSKSIKRLYQDVLQDIQVNSNFDRLSGLHTLVTALKVYATESVANHLETCRRSLGGHGYLQSSGIFDLFTTFVAAITYEGENGVLEQQPIKYLLKLLAQVQKDSQFPLELPFAFVRIGLTNTLAKPIQLFFNDGLDFPSAYQVLASCTYQLLLEIQTEVQLKNQELVQTLIPKLIKTFAQFFTLQSNLSQLDSLEDGEVKLVLNSVFTIFTINLLLDNQNTILSYNLLDLHQIRTLKVNLTHQFKLLRTHAVKLTDGFLFTDEDLNSSLGSYHGEAYKNILSEIDSNPMNLQVDQNGLFHGVNQFILPLTNNILQEKVKREGKSRL